ncbi:MAG: thymidine phosphorylase, partial [Clostridia bacterium]
SGDMMEFSDELVTVDKHSTGGVGDKTSLIVAPMAAGFGLTVAKMSGRALGHTGGTVDKLESIPGMKVDMSLDEFEKVYRETGICISGQSGNMVPADKILYSLRDVTATISCIPLIATSIMSKKLAAGAKNIVLDVKTGSGAFMENPEEAFVLAEKMVGIGQDNGRNVSALVTMMDAPLGYCIGNSLEVMEAIDVLKGGCAGSDLCEVSIALTAELISMTSGMDVRDAAGEAKRRIADGSALKKLRDMIIAQGGNAAVIDDYSLFKQPRTVIEVRSPESGYISAIDAKSIGAVSMNLGAGRSSKTDPIDYSAGIRLAKKPGDRVEKGGIMAHLYTDRENAAGQAESFLDACEFSKTRTKEKKLILGRVSKDGREVY